MYIVSYYCVGANELYDSAYASIQTAIALVVKWISQQSSELLLGVRVPPGAQNKRGEDA